MKLVFMGTPALAVPSLEILRADHDIALVVTQPDKPGGRGHQLVTSPVKQYATELGIPVSQPARAREEEFIEQLRATAPDAIVVVAYGQILPRAILELPPHGCINLHFSLLPRWRGAAPVQHAILNGDKTTGVTTQWMAEKLDAGEIILQQTVEIHPHETAGELFERLTPIGAQMLKQTVDLVAQGTAPRLPQDETQVTFAPTLKKEDGRINWSLDANTLTNQVRALNPWPVAWCEFGGQMLKIWRASANTNAPCSTAEPGTIINVSSNVVAAAAGYTALQLLEVQAAGRPRMSAGDWARGVRLTTGQRLS